MEIKNRLALIALSWWSIVSALLFNKENVLFYVIRAFDYSFSEIYFVFSSLPDIFLTYIFVIIFFATQFSTPTVVYHVFCFLSPSQKKSSSRTFYGAAVKVMISYYFILPLVTSSIIPSVSRVLLSISSDCGSFFSYGLFFEANIFSFSVFYCQLYKSVLNFTLFWLFIIVILSLLNFSKSTLRSIRRWLYCLFCLTSLTLAPPDFVSEIIVFLFLIFVFEIYAISVCFSPNKFYDPFLIRKPVEANEKIYCEE